MNRRRFFKDSALALVVTKYLVSAESVVKASISHSPFDAVDEVMKAAVSNVLEINNFLKRLASDFENLKKTKVAEDHLEKSECTKVLSIIGTVVIVVTAAVVAAVTFGAGAQIVALKIIEASKKVSDSLALLARWESEIEKRNKMTPEIRAAIVRFRELTEDFKDVLVARDIFFHISQDRTHAKKLLDAISARNRQAIEEMLKRDVPGSDVVVTDVKEDNGAFVNVRIGNLTHCLSTSAQCSRRLSTTGR